MKRYSWLRRVGVVGMVGLVSCLGIARAEEPKSPAPSPPATERPKLDIQIDSFQVEGPKVTTKVIPDGRRAAPAPYWLGLEVYPVEGALRAQLHLAEKQGLVVESAVPDGPAGKGGIVQHDVLLTAGKTELHEQTDLIAAINEAQDKPLEIKLLRAGAPQTVTVTPARRPDGPMRPRGNFSGRLLDRLSDRMVPGGGPLQFQFLHPGMVLPPGAATHREFPKDLNITINKSGDAPLSIEVRRGEQTWKVTEDDIASLPETVRGYAQEMLGGMPFAGGGFAVELPNLPGSWQGLEPRDHLVPARPGKADARVEEQLNDVTRQLQKLLGEVEQLRNRPRPSDENAPAPQDNRPEKRPEPAAKQKL